MRHFVTNQATAAARDWLTLALAGLGISFAWHEYFGGLFLALAGASAMARERRDPRRFWSILVTAFLVATLAAVVFGRTEIMPIQAIMAGAGLASGWVMAFVGRMLDRVSDRADDVADKIIDKVLPGDGDQ